VPDRACWSLRHAQPHLSQAARPVGVPCLAAKPPASSAEQVAVLPRLPAAVRSSIQSRVDIAFTWNALFHAAPIFLVKSSHFERCAGLAHGRKPVAQVFISPIRALNRERTLSIVL